jgi:hypothetical protein
MSIWTSSCSSSTIATEEEMQIDTVAERLRAEIAKNNSVFCTLPALGIWALTD